MFDPTNLLETARSYHSRGQIAEAERLYWQVLGQEPQNVEALTLLGGAYIGLGRPAEAADILRQACRLAPGHAPAHDNLGIALANLNRLAEAQQSFELATRLNPESSGTWLNLGNVYLKQGLLPAAVTPFEHAVRCDPASVRAATELADLLLKLGRYEPAAVNFAHLAELRPDDASAHFHRGVALAALRRYHEAQTCYERALQILPNHPETLINLGSVLNALGRHGDAVTYLQRAVAQRPNLGEAHNNLGIALSNLGQYEAAARSIQRAIELKPTMSEAHNNLGNVLAKQFEFLAALAAYQEAIRLKPDDAELHHNLGNMWYRLREPRLAIDEANLALRLWPEYPKARYLRAVSSLVLGDFAAGWADFEARWQCPEFKPHHYTQPMWNCATLGGRRILLFAEQGLGDTLQMIRYLPRVKQLGGHTIVAVQKPLLKLLARVEGADELRSLEMKSTDFDIYAPLVSLPRILAADERTIPADVPYLQAAGDRVDFWRRELSSLGGLKVGLAWQGNPDYPDDRLRSIPLAELMPLAQVRSASFVSLQKGPGSEQLATLTDRFPIRTLGADFDESSGAFVDTAAVMMSLDLVITSDTAIAHLAGALGRPVWVLLPFAPDWRWMLERSDSPWYPTMRLFRQQALGEWRPVIEAVAAALAGFAH